MIKIEVLSVRNPRWANSDGSSIECLISTNTLIGEVPFTASKFDPEPHGRDVYARCVVGEFGEIAPMEPQVQNHGNGLPSPVPPQFERLQRFLVEANQENSRQSYRSVAVLWASLIDNLLDELVVSKTVKTEKTSVRPPTTFDQRIKRALAMGCIDKKDAEKCHHVRRIRNSAAHDWELSLSSPDVLPGLYALYQSDHSQVFVFHEDLDFLIRQVYSGSCAALAMKFTSQLAELGSD